MNNRNLYNPGIVIKPALLLLMVLNNVMASAQKEFTITGILEVITTVHPITRMYDADIKSVDEASKGAKSWMPPEAGAGFFMTPYSVSRWKKMSEMEPGMGSFMVSVQQMFPNRKKLYADALYMQSMSASMKEQKRSALNELYAK